MQLRNQVLPTRIFGILPKSMLHLFMRPFMNNLGTSAVNAGKYVASLRPAHVPAIARGFPFPV